MEHLKLKVNKKKLKENLYELGVSDLSRSQIINEIYLMFSLNCNLHCNFCSFWGITGSCHDKEFFKKTKIKMTRKDIDKIAKGILSFKVRTVSFSGGEPLLFKDWYYAAKAFKKSGAVISLTTNGVYIEKNIKKIEEVVDEINLSLQAPPEAIHVVRNDHPSHIKKIIKGLKKINLLKQKHQGRPRLKILCTVSDMNYKYLEGLMFFLKKEKISVDQYGFQHMMFLDKKTINSQKRIFLKEFNIKEMPLWNGFTYPFPENLNFNDFREELKKVAKYKNVIFSPNLPAEELENYYIKCQKPVHYENYCSAPWTQLNILPNGDFYVCNDYILGNIKKNSFEEIWNGNKSRNLRKYTAKKLFPACWRCFYYYCDRIR